mmetsp:Transcript_24072/g.69652  ORF Transcript_24072/g.69652 Transcript_24072/m.69652 type:complete len:301 (-) Transcript_24072:61-963(-)
MSGVVGVAGLLTEHLASIKVWTAARLGVRLVHAMCKAPPGPYRASLASMSAPRDNKVGHSWSTSSLIPNARASGVCPKTGLGSLTALIECDRSPLQCCPEPYNTDPVIIVAAGTCVMAYFGSAWASSNISAISNVPPSPPPNESQSGEKWPKPRPFNRGESVFTEAPASRRRTSRTSAALPVNTARCNTVHRYPVETPQRFCGSPAKGPSHFSAARKESTLCNQGTAAGSLAFIGKPCKWCGRRHIRYLPHAISPGSSLERAWSAAAWKRPCRTLRSASLSQTIGLPSMTCPSWQHVKLP